LRLLAVTLLCFAAGVTWAQEGDEAADTATVVQDSVVEVSPEAEPSNIEANDDAATPPVSRGEYTPTIEDVAIGTAKTWLRRLLYRGWVNPTIIGAYSTYQLTDWSEATGSYGGVEGRLTIHYLGPIEWMGRDAESFQAAFQALDEESNLVEFDLILPATQRVSEIFRSLMRVNRGDLRPTSFALPEGIVDYDVLDRALEAGKRDLKIYAGTFETELYRGSGTDGSEVLIHRAAKIAPLEIAILGYGAQALTYSSSGSNVVPRFRVPPTPGGR
jgi:hypothetical protein